MADQHRADVMGCSGNPCVKTPNLDSLAQSGMRFDSAFSPMPLCVPARSMLLTGRYGHKTGVNRNPDYLPEHFIRFPQFLNEKGFYTEAIGKMHFRPARNHNGFQRMQLMEEIAEYRQDDEYMKFLNENGFGDIYAPHGLRSENYLKPQKSQVPEEFHGTTWVADRTIEFLKKNKNRKFFCWSSFIEPHPPFQLPEEYLNMYSPDDVPSPAKGKDEPDSIYMGGINATHRQFAENLPEEEVQLMRAQYYACVSHLDYHIGRILDSLDELGLGENTIVIYLSDHGEYLGDHGLWGKGACFYDSALKIPFIIRWPGKTVPGTVSGQYVSLLDFFPTLMGMIGYEGDKSEYPGMNLAEHIKNSDSSIERDFIFGELYENQYMALCPDWKYNYYVSGAFEELYDRKNDPGEINNLAGIAKYANIKQHLRETLLDWLGKEKISAALEGNSFKQKVMPQRSTTRMVQPPIWQNNEIKRDNNRAC